MPQSGTRRLTLVSLALTASLSGCAGQESRTDEPGTPAPSQQSATDADSPSEPAGPQPTALRTRCGFPVAGRTFALPGPDAGTTLAAAELGRGPRVAVFVHQTDSTGLCGWLPYAEWASRQGVHALLVDACGYGESVCSEESEADPATWIGAVADWARSHGAQRVTLVGASMGGSLVTGAASRVDADAVVNLSGPPRWEGVPPVTRAAAALEVPLLAAAAASDTDIDAGALRRATTLAPRGSRYVPAPDGHGWTMVIEGGYSSDPAGTVPTPLGRLVADWISGRVGP